MTITVKGGKTVSQVGSATIAAIKSILGWASTPTAIIHIKEGTEILPPLKFTEASFTSVAQSGAIEYDGNAFYATETNVRRAITLGNDTMLTDVVVVDTVDETTIYTSPIVADELKAGKMYKVTLLGKFSTASAGDLFDMKFKIGNVEIFDAALNTGNVADAHFRAQFWLTVRSVGATGTYAAHIEATLGDDLISITPTSGTFNTGLAEDITVTVQWNAAKAGNTLTLMQGVLEVIN